MIFSSVKEAIGPFINDVKTLAVAVSGGADSMALLNIMLGIKDEYGIEVFAAHFNHKLRGEESERDMLFVKDFCENHGIKLICGEGDVLSYAAEQKISTELSARKLRYDFFDKLPADLVATAHTASDNLETVLFNLTRGSGINGLCGIPVKRGKYIRPLIFCTREDIELYCKENGINYVTDSTNLKDDYTRNRIRHKIVPLLKELNPSVENNVSNTSVLLSFDRDTLDSFAQTEYKKMISKSGLDVKNLTDLPVALWGRVLRIFYSEKTGGALDYKHNEDLFEVAVNGGRCSLPGGAMAERQKGILKISFLNKPISYNVNIRREKIDLIKKDKKVNNLLLNNLLDCDKIVGKLSVRVRENGDKIRLRGRGCTKTLKQLYNEKGIPLNIRKVLPVISDDNGPVWICGMGVAQRASVSSNSKYVYIIDYEII